MNNMPREWPVEHRLSELLLSVVFRVHKQLGPGLLTATYESCVRHELDQLGLHLEVRQPVPIRYGGIQLSSACEVPLWIEKKLVVMLLTEPYTELHMAQMRTYLRLTDCRIGFLINFNVTTLKRGVRRIISSGQSVSDRSSVRIVSTQTN